ncbi:MAG: hypothetical protein ACTTKH_07625 [Treponema sp.]
MSEDRFFDIIHAYFGEIKTPFNKHNLLEKLSSFLLNEEIRKNIINALSYEDLKLIASIHYLKNPSVDTLKYTFIENSPNAIKKKLINLEERLLIYRETNSNNHSMVKYSVNPLLVEPLLPFLNMSFLLPYEDLEDSISVEPLLTPVFFSSFYSYIVNNTDIFKKDGSFKKKAYDNIISIFPVLKYDLDIIETIFNSFINLKLIKKTENEIIIIEEQWKKFAGLTHFEKLIYISASEFFCNTCIECNIAAIFNELLHTLKKGAWYFEEDVYRAFFLIYQKYAGPNDRVCLNYTASNLLSFKIIINKLLYIAGKLGVIVERKNIMAFNEYFRNIVEDEKPLLLSSTYEVIISQYASLNNLLPILSGVKIIKSQTFASFEFSRQTCEKLFQKGLDAKEIHESLQLLSNHPIPQNVVASIEQWYKSYKSISLYFGFVLCVDAKKKKFFENGTPLSKLVKKNIGDGIYLLENSNIKEINTQLKKAGLDFIFYDLKDNKVNIDVPYERLEKEFESAKSESKAELLNEIKKREDVYLQKEIALLEKLQNEELDIDVKNILYDRVKRRVILTENQLNPATINTKAREVKAFDFLGKIKFLEEAKTQKYLLEITMNDKSIIIGYIEEMWKNFKENTIVQITDDVYSKFQYLDVSQILKIKVVIQSIFT